MAATSDSAAEDMSLLMVIHSVWTELLSCDVGLIASEYGVSTRE